MFQLNHSILKSFLLLSCLFYFILLSLTAYGIAYTIENSHNAKLNNSNSENYYKQVIIPVYVCKESLGLTIGFTKFC